MLAFGQNGNQATTSAVYKQQQKLDSHRPGIPSWIMYYLSIILSFAMLKFYWNSIATIKLCLLRSLCKLLFETVSKYLDSRRANNVNSSGSAALADAVCNNCFHFGCFHFNLSICFSVVYSSCNTSSHPSHPAA